MFEATITITHCALIGDSKSWKNVMTIHIWDQIEWGSKCAFVSTILP